MSRIVVIGGTGTIGSEIVDQLEEDHDVFPVGHTSGPYRVDLESDESVADLLQSLETIDHLISAAGEARFGPLKDLAEEDFQKSVQNKLMGQIRLVRIGLDHVADGGSFTLTSGILASKPTSGSAAITTVNAGIEGFVRAADLELERELRINAVSPGWVAETLEAMGRDPSEGVPAARVAETYVELLDADGSGDVVTVE